MLLLVLFWEQALSELRQWVGPKEQPDFQPHVPDHKMMRCFLYSMSVVSLCLSLVMILSGVSWGKGILALTLWSQASMSTGLHLGWCGWTIYVGSWHTLDGCNFLSGNCFHWPWVGPCHLWCCSHPGIKVLAAFSWPFLQGLVHDNFSKHTYQAGLCMAYCKKRTRVLEITSQRKKCRKSQEKPEWKKKPEAKHEITQEDQSLGLPLQCFLLTTLGKSLPCAFVSLHLVLECWTFPLPCAESLAFHFGQTW